MTRRAMMAVVAVYLSGSVAWGDGPGRASPKSPSAKVAPTKPSSRPGPPEPVLETVPDPYWEPEPGARVTVQADTARGAVSYGDFADFLDATKAGDQAGIAKALGARRVVHLAKGTAVLVITDHRPDPGPGRTRSSSGMASAMLSARPAADPGVYPVEVRVIDGEQAGKSLFVGRADIARMVERRVVHTFRSGDRATVVGPWGMITNEPSKLSLHDLAQLNGNPAGAAAMFRSGEIAKIPGGVKVIVLGTQYEYVRVRIHSGSKAAGSVGYMMRRDLVPTPGYPVSGPRRAGP